jgi:tetratricopeptide (TPR) repeat protein
MTMGAIAIALAAAVCAGLAHAGVRDNRGAAYFKKGEYDKAIADETKAIEIDPKFAEAYVNRGIAYLAKGEHDKAIADFTKAIQLKPDLAEAYYNRGVSYERLGRKAEAIADYRSTLALSRLDTDAQAALKRLGAAP